MRRGLIIQYHNLFRFEYPDRNLVATKYNIIIKRERREREREREIFYRNTTRLRLTHSRVSLVALLNTFCRLALVLGQTTASKQVGIA